MNHVYVGWRSALISILLTVLHRYCTYFYRQWKRIPSEDTKRKWKQVSSFDVSECTRYSISLWHPRHQKFMYLMITTPRKKNFNLKKVQKIKKKTVANKIKSLNFHNDVKSQVMHPQYHYCAHQNDIQISIKWCCFLLLVCFFQVC